MARIFHRDEWYEELGPGSLFEQEFEEIFRKYVPQIYPGCVAVPFKKTVSSDDASARADLALIQMDYLGWWVVEIERRVHSLNHHVLPQVRTLANAAYGRHEAKYLASKHPELSERRIFDMIRGEQPAVLVVVDRPCDDWKPPLTELGALLAIFQIFRSERGRQLVRLNGDHPFVREGGWSLCVPDRTLANLLRVEKPGLLPEMGLEQKIAVRFQEQLTFWRRIETADAVYLRPTGRLDLEPGRRYRLALRDGSLVLAPQGNGHVKKELT